MSTDDQGNEIGKLFVGGLHQSTTNESFKNYFSKFGDVIEGSVMVDHKTGRSRGFGYVRYDDNDSVLKVMSMKHNLDGKDIDPKPCNVNMKGRSRLSLKVFVGGIAPDHNEETLRDFFKQFGNVLELTLMRDQSGQRHRGFAFVAFDDENVVKQLVSDHYLQIGNKQVEIKPMATQMNRANNGMMMNQGIGMNAMQGNQWPQWSPALGSAWAAPAAWGGWAGNNGGAGGPNMWEQGNSSWGGATSWNNGAIGGNRGTDMMTNGWDTSMWTGNAMAASAGMQHNQAVNNGWGPITNGYLDQRHANNQWNTTPMATAFGGVSTSSHDWRSNNSTGNNTNSNGTSQQNTSMHGHVYPFKR